MTAFWDLAPCSLAEVSIIIRAINIALMMVAVSTSKTSVNFYQTTRRKIPEDSHLHTRILLKLQDLHCLALRSLNTGMHEDHMWHAVKMTHS
jgi:hypothetical protein